jgi:hypothetical protein
MLALMLDPHFKSMQLVTMYLGQENVVALVVEYDDELLLPLVTEVAKLLMLSSGAKFENLVTQVNSKNLVFTTTMNVDFYRDLVSRELIGYCQYVVDVGNCKCALSWWRKEKNMFPIIALVTQHIFGILANQINIKHIFYVVGIFITLQIDNMDKFIFLHKN